jgi:DNA-binding winged helix-turn-helix (wHTH) protein/pimeloyl-ACP methyl ester carboxylesterase
VRYLFDDYVLDIGRRELRRGAAAPVSIEPQVFDLLVYLVQNREHVVTKDDLIAGVWHGRIVSDSTLTSRITAVRKAIGDSGEQQALIRTVPRKGLRFVGAVREDSGEAPAVPVKPADSILQQHRLRQDVRFCTAADGTRIAYASVGEGPPLIKTANWLNHLEFDWESPVWSPLFQALAAEHQLIRYDARGNGLSDWDVEDMSLDTFVRDLEIVIEVAAPQRFSLFGMSQGSATAIAYAVAHPERVSHLVLAGSFARGRQKRGSVQDAATAEAMMTLMRQGWGQENPAFRQMFTSLFIPDGTPEQVQWWNDLQRITTSPENAVRLRKVVDQIDVTHLLPQVTVPTLVLHCRDDAVQPFDEGRRVAAGIPGARFIALEGRNHAPLKGEPAWDRLLQEVRDFIRT